MDEAIVNLSVPARPAFARSVRMMAANLAVLCSMNVDEVENARMAAEEAFVVACATHPATCEVAFTVGESGLSMRFSLGEGALDADAQVREQVSLSKMLLECVSDVFEIDRVAASLSVECHVGGSDGR